MGALRPALNSRRSAIVNAAWDRIAEGKDCIMVDLMCECYDVSRNGDFIEGNLTKEQIFEQFSEGLSYNCQPVTVVGKECEWRFYMEDLSLSIVDD